MLKFNVDFDTMLIRAEGARHLQEKRIKGNPTGEQPRGCSRTARGKRAPRAEINIPVKQSQKN
jgi:hypothetical protein